MDAQVAVPETEKRQMSAMARRVVAVDGVQVRVVADAVLTTDPRRVERILANLASNALRHGAHRSSCRWTARSCTSMTTAGVSRPTSSRPSHFRPPAIPYHRTRGTGPAWA
jgi:K+-sensing histidine kinase KdpD